MFIQTEPTPNPETLKFLPGQAIMTRGTAEFLSEKAAGRSPLAKRLFKIDGVRGVFLAPDFVSVTKDIKSDWTLLKPHILGALMDHLMAGLPAIEEDVDAVAGHETGQDDDVLVLQIKELLDTRVRPAVAQDGGDITFVRFEDGIVYLRMRGACAGCPSSTMTLKSGIENMLRHYVPEIDAVEAVE